MAGLIVLGILVGILVLILLIPVGVDLGYEQDKLHVSAKVMGLLLQLYPKPPPGPNRKPKKKKPKKEKKPKKPAAEGEKPKKKRKLSFSRDELLELARAALRGVGNFGRKLQVDRFVLRFRAAGEDPYNTAMLYGWVNAALSSLAPLCRRRFAVKDCDVRTEVDFAGEKMHLDLGLAMTIRIGQLLGVGLGIGFRALVVLLKSKRRRKREAKLAPPEQQTPADAAPAEDGGAAAPEEKTETNTQTIQAEERKDSNGDQ